MDVEVVVVGEEQDVKYNFDIDEVLSNAASDITVYWHEITSVDKIPYGWEGSEPYGDYTGTCEAMMIEILEEQEREKNRAEQDKLQLKLDLDM